MCIYRILQSRLLNFHCATKILVVAFGKFSGDSSACSNAGWFSTELVASRLLPLYNATRGSEFDLNTLAVAFDSNIALVCADRTRRLTLAAAGVCPYDRHLSLDPERHPEGIHIYI